MNAMRNVFGATAAVILSAGATAGTPSLMVVDSGSDRVMLFDGFNGSLLDVNWLTDVGAVGWFFTTPKEAAVVGSEIWVSDQVADAVHRFDMGRNFLGSITAHPSGGNLDNIRGFGFDGTNAYVTVFHGTTSLRGVASYNAAGTAQGFFPGNTTSASFFDAQPFMGDLLVSNSVSDALERWTTTGTYLGNFATGVVDPQQISVLADNSVLSVSTIAASGIEGVYHHNSDGTLRRFIDTEGLKVAFGETVPRSAWLLGDGNYLIGGSTGVYKFDVGSNLFSQVLGGVDAQYINALIPAPGAGALALPLALAWLRRRR